MMGNTHVANLFALRGILIEAQGTADVPRVPAIARYMASILVFWTVATFP